MAEVAQFWLMPLPSARHIRLLRVTSPVCDRGQVHERAISGHEIFDINALPSYHALSYTWGQMKAEETIEMHDGSRLAVTKNLKIGLPYILAQCSAGYLFVDQLCINQEDLTERSQQVALMGMIFSRSKSVLVWLGPRIERQGILIWLLEQLGDEGRVSAFRQLTDKYHDYKGTATFKGALQRVRRDRAEEPIIQTLLEIFRSPWVRCQPVPCVRA